MNADLSVRQLVALPTAVTPDPSRLESLRLPPASQMAQGTPHGAIDFRSEVEAWLCDDPPLASLPSAAPTPRSARWGARPKL